jgi:hypothetical protein
MKVDYLQLFIDMDLALKFIEELIWKTQMEERQKGVSSGVNSVQLHIIKEALE